ncbi:MAG: GNAT family protein [Vampirovibrionales bacterium]|nr:GNAT family protein [Vampirovibrionales bacterium]
MIDKSPPFEIRRIQHHQQLVKYAPSLCLLLNRHDAALRDDFTSSDSPYLSPSDLQYSSWRQNALFLNVRSTIPYLWLAVAGQQVLAATCLSDETPDWQAKIHGVSVDYDHGTSDNDFASEQRPDCSKKLRRAVIEQTSLAAMNFAFDMLNLHKLTAQFDVDNHGARGYCLRMGFQREARLLAETRRNGQPVDQYRYVLFRDDYFKKTKLHLHNVQKTCQ